MRPANLLITNFCNQSCPFCFASAEMAKPGLQREMSLSDFRLLLGKLKKADVKVIKFLGGEPTLHSQLETLLAESAPHFSSLQIFTNGLYSPVVAALFERHFPKLKLTFNSVTPGFLLRPQLRQLVLKHIQAAAEKTQVTLSLTVDPLTNVQQVFSLVKQQEFKRVFNYRVGMSNPIATEGNYYTFADFPKMGAQLIRLIREIEVASPQATISLNCGFTRCMFTDEEYAFLKTRTLLRGWSCFGKGGSMDVTTQLEAFPCFPLSTLTENRHNLRSLSVKKTQAKMLLQRHAEWKKTVTDKCQKCPFYGLDSDHCPGPCLAFRYNEPHESS